MSTHTPGSWVAEPTEPHSGFNCWTIVAPTGDVAWAKGYQHEDEKIANAKLIAAAPELLEALKAVVSVADRKTVEFEMAHAAIAKATGGQS